MSKLLSAFARDRRGNAAVEFALVAPIILAMFLSSYGLWEAANRGQDMRAALDAGAQYYMNGGASDPTAQQTVESAWKNRPQDSSVNISHNCKCQSVAMTCSSVCADLSPPSDYVDITLTSKDPAALMNNQLLENRVVRVR
ncbi:MAG TPA: TadE/TadG family type IV pilus assembly protein [Phenylobacterium sp.]|nr:TadE/TadG family type IV pilus assembly protein [Phenylobacterium sp.]